jgi:hypothetical protein
LTFLLGIIEGEAEETVLAEQDGEVLDALVAVVVAVVVVVAPYTKGVLVLVFTTGVVVVAVVVFVVLGTAP